MQKLRAGEKARYYGQELSPNALRIGEGWDINPVMNNIYRERFVG